MIIHRIYLKIYNSILIIINKFINKNHLINQKNINDIIMNICCAIIDYFFAVISAAPDYDLEKIKEILKQ